jgi:WD40 repeat protein
MIQHQSPISGVATFGGRYVATAGYDNRVILWDAQSGSALARGWHDHLVNQIAFSPCGRYLATTSSDYTARIWSVPDLRLLTILTGHDDDVEGIAFHGSQELVATSCRDSKVRVYSFQGLVKEFSGHKADSISVVWDGADDLISSSDDGTIKRWSLSSGLMTEDLDLGGVETDTIAIGTGGIIFAGNDLGEIIMIKDGKHYSVPAHDAGIKRLVFEPHLNKIASLSYDRKVKIWSFDGHHGLKECHSANLPPMVWPRNCAFLSENEIVFASFGSKYIRYDFNSSRWDLREVNDTGGINAVYSCEGQFFTVGDSGIVKNSDAVMTRIPSLCNFIVKVGPILLTGGQTGQIFNARTGDCYYQFRSPLNCAAAFEREGEAHVIIGTYTGEGLVFRWCEAALELRFDRVISLHKNAIKALSCSGDLIFSVSASSDAAFHRISDFSLVHLLERAHEKIANGCDFVAHEQFVSVSRDLKLRLWDGEQVKSVLSPHQNSIKCVAVNRENHWVGTGDYSGHLGIYCLKTHKWIYFQRMTDHGISSIIAHANGFVMGAYDGKLYAWEVS